MKTKVLLAMTLASLLALTTLAGCSREKIDWKSAEAADTVEGYDHFIERHPDSALAVQARTRVAQLNEDRDWKRATGADTLQAYREFLLQHEGGKWAEEARIRVENFALDGTATGPAKPSVLAEAAPAAAAVTPSGPAGPNAAAPASAAATSGGAALPAHGPKESQPAPPGAAKPAVVAATPPDAAPAKAPTKPAAAVTRVASANGGSGSAAAPSRPVSAGSSPAATKATAPSRPDAAKPPFGIQLGAFHTQDAALKNWKQLQAKYDSDLHGLFAHAVPVKQTSGDLFRLQAPVGEESRARAICASLAKQSQPCVVVLPQP